MEKQLSDASSYKLDRTQGKSPEPSKNVPSLPPLFNNRGNNKVAADILKQSEMSDGDE